MTIRRMRAGRGPEWLMAGVRLFGRQPAVLAGMGALIALLNWLPVLGGLILTVLGPALFGGLMFALREVQAGRRAEFGQLFAGFRIPQRLPKLVVLCLPGIVAGFVASWLFVDLYGAETVQAIATGSRKLDEIAPLPGKSAGMTALAALLALWLAYLAVFFALPQVLFRGSSPWTAMAQSLVASAINLLPLLLYLVALLALAVLTVLSFALAGLLLSVLGGWVVLLASLAAIAVLLPIALAANLLAWQAVFGDLDSGPDQEASAEL